MAENGAALQSYNNELVKCIEDLCTKRDDVSREIKMDEQEKEKLEHDIAILHERLQKVVTNLARKTQIRDEYGKFFYLLRRSPRTSGPSVVPDQSSPGFPSSFLSTQQGFIRGITLECIIWSLVDTH